ncbi:hypothetical protein S245_017470 [Arachis hypogaea]|nr:uncharacterized protein DS421_5g158980 [Arachis hypogaea]
MTSENSETGSWHSILFILHYLLITPNSQTFFSFFLLHHVPYYIHLPLLILITPLLFFLCHLSPPLPPPFTFFATFTPHFPNTTTTTTSITQIFILCYSTNNHHLLCSRPWRFQLRLQSYSLFRQNRDTQAHGLVGLLLRQTQVPQQTFSLFETFKTRF